MTGGDPSEPLPSGGGSSGNNNTNGEPAPPATVSFAESNLRNLGLDARASSPAKRTRAERDGFEEHMTRNGDSDGVGASARSPKKTSQHVSPMPNRFKPVNDDPIKHTSSPLVDMEDINSVQSRSEQSAAVSEESAGFRADGTSSNVSTNVSSPPTSVEGEAKGAAAEPDYDAQYEKVKDIVERNPPKEGMKGYVVPTSWITRVASRTTAGSHEGHPKSFREGPVGPVPTLDLAIRDAGELRDSKGQPFIPLKSGLALDTDCVMLPESAWKLLLEWYGLAEGHTEIVRFAHDTSLDITRENIMWELYPPICTIRKLRNSNDVLGIDQMRERDATAPRVVTSRQETFQSFLDRAKSAAGIGETIRTRVWKVVEALPTSTGQSSMPTPVSSRANSPAPSTLRPAPSLILDLHQFAAWPEIQRELIDIKDECDSPKTSDNTLIETVGLSEMQQLVLEEQVRESNDNEEFIMDGLRKNAASHGIDIGASKSDHLTVGDVSRPKANISAARRSPTPSGIMTRGRSNKKKKNSGAVGLQNLGNTCYMNSALQCLRAVQELAVYFLMEEYVKEINIHNPIGKRGQIARAYATLVHSIFQATNSFSPRAFKTTLGKVEPLFSGYGQQDSQEFLSFLIDALHEDLNRDLTRPPTSNPDSDDARIHDPRYINELGEEFRRLHRLRNASISMDLFNGFYKNTMVCPVCDKVSVTFDPYSALTLQLPVENLWQHDMRFVPLAGTPLTIDVEMSKNSNIKSLKQYIGSKVNVEAERLLMVEVYQEKIYKVFEDIEIISEANITATDDLIFYELDEAPTNWPPAPEKSRKRSLYSGYGTRTTLPDMDADEAAAMAVPVLNRVADAGGSSKGRFKKWPTFILLTRKETRDYEVILRKILQRVEVMTSRPMFTEDGQPGGEVKNANQTPDTESTSSDDQKVQAQSVESEDGLVDVSMTDDAHENTATPNSTSPLNDPAFYITAQYRNMFKMRYYGGPSEDMIPSGGWGVTENNKYDELASREVQPEEEPPAVSEDDSAAGNSSESDDELHGDDNEDMTRGNFGRRQSGSSTSSESMQPSRDRTGMSGHQFLSTKKAKPAQKDPNEGYLIRLGEGIMLDWTAEAWDGLFGGDKDDDMRGTNTLDDAPTLKDPELQARRERRQSRRKHGVSLDECFDETTRTEILSEDNAWRCPRCKEHRRASKTLEIWTLPDILVIHLKRFASSRNLRDKVEVFVDFPIEGLNMESRVGNPEGKTLTYDLFAVDNHFGGLGGGHYTAVTKNFQDGNWYDYNDAFVSRTSPESAVTKAAYLLFYRRRSETTLGPQYLKDLVDRAYAAESRPSSPSGEDQANDDSSSLNGSSTDSQQAGAGATRLPQQGHLVGPVLKGGSRGGDRGSALESQAQSGSHDTPRTRTLTAIGPSNFDDDEGISMTDNDHDPDQPLPSYEDAAAEPPSIMAHTQSWGFSQLRQQQPSPAGSSNEAMDDNMSDRNIDDLDADDDTAAIFPLGRDDLSRQNSPVPLAGDTDTEMRDSDDFVESSVRTTGRRGTRQSGFEHVASLGHDIDDSGDELPVAEVRVDNDDGA